MLTKGLNFPILSVPPSENSL